MTTPSVPPYDVWVELLDQNLVSQGLMPYVTIAAELYYNAVGSWSLMCQYTDALWAQVMRLHSAGALIVKVNWRNVFEFGGKCETPGYSDTLPGSTASGGGGGSLSGPFITLAGADYLSILANRIIYPDPTKPWANQLPNSSDSVVGTPLETAIKYFVNRNIGSTAIMLAGSPPVSCPPAISSRQNSLLDIGTDHGRGGAVAYAVKFNSQVNLNMLEVLRAMINSVYTPGQPLTQMGLKVVRNGQRLLFDVYVPRDLSKTVWFSEETGNLTSVQFSVTDPLCTHALVMGQTAPASATMSGWNQWNMVEHYLNSANETSNANLLAAAQDELISNSQGPQMAVVVTDTPFLVFGRDYQLGDTITVQIKNSEAYPDVQSVYTDIVSGVTITCDPSQTPALNVVPVIGNSGDAGTLGVTESRLLLSKIKKIEKKLNSR